MASRLSSDDALYELQRDFGQRITQGVKSLLESKHLYQSTRLEYQDLLNAILEKRVVNYPGEVTVQFPKLIQANWVPVDNAYEGMRHPGKPSSETDWSISFNPPDVKLFCQTCGRIEAFNSISSEDFLQRDQPSRPFESSGQTVNFLSFPSSVNHVNLSPKCSWFAVRG